MTNECLFVKYERYINHNYDFVRGKSIKFEILLDKCTCERCMKEKEEGKKALLTF